MASKTKAVVETPLGYTEQNTHSENLFWVSMISVLIIALIVWGLWLGGKRICNWLNRREPLDGSLAPTDKASLW